MKRIYLTIIGISLLFSCAKNKSDIKIYDFSSMFTLVDSIQLETNEDSYIPFIMAEDFYNDKWYLCDQYSIYMFDKTGKYKSKFGEKGEGPKEFSYLSDIKIDENNNLLALDPFGSKITVIDTNLKYINSNKIQFGSCANFYKIGQNYYFYNRNIFEDSLTIKKYDAFFNYQYSIVDFPYNSVVQVFLGGNCSFTYAEDIDKILVTHLYDPYLKIFAPDAKKISKKIPLNFALWKDVDEKKVKRIFPQISSDPQKLYSYLNGKIKIYKLFYLSKGNVLLHYGNFRKKEHYFQFLNMENNQINYVIVYPESKQLLMIKNGYAYFYKSHYKQEKLQNPTIYKYEINTKFYK